MVSGSTTVLGRENGFGRAGSAPSSPARAPRSSRRASLAVAAGWLAKPAWPFPHVWMMYSYLAQCVLNRMREACLEPILLFDSG